jgi:hypothetical protein
MTDHPTPDWTRPEGDRANESLYWFTADDLDPPVYFETRVLAGRRQFRYSSDDTAWSEEFDAGVAVVEPAALMEQRVRAAYLKRLGTP